VGGKCERDLTKCPGVGTIRSCIATQTSAYMAQSLPTATETTVVGAHRALNKRTREVIKTTVVLFSNTEQVRNQTNACDFSRVG
jgi:hypothetical protein